MVCDQHKEALRPLVVGLGGTLRPGSSTESALKLALGAAETAGARTELFDGAFLASLPTYDPTRMDRSPEQERLVEAVRQASGLILATPAYHAGVSGVVKNAIDLLEDLSQDERPYLDGRAVGCVITGYGWQACGATLMSLRAIIHALRGWPTPMGAALNVSGGAFGADGVCLDEKMAQQIDLTGKQVVQFSLARQLLDLAETEPRSRPMRAAV